MTTLMKEAVRPWHWKRHRLFPRTFTSRVVLVLLLYKRLQRQAEHHHAAEQAQQPRPLMRLRLRHQQQGRQQGEHLIHTLAVEGGRRHMAHAMPLGERQGFARAHAWRRRSASSLVAHLTRCRLRGWCPAVVLCAHKHLEHARRRKALRRGGAWRAGGERRALEALFSLSRGSRAAAGAHGARYGAADAAPTRGAGA